MMINLCTRYTARDVRDIQPGEIPISQKTSVFLVSALLRRCEKKCFFSEEFGMNLGVLFF